MKAFLVVAGALLMAGPAVAQQNSNGVGGAVRSGGSVPEGSSEAGTNANGERRICRRIESTGSRTAARRVCMTAPEWRVYDSTVGEE